MPSKKQVTIHDVARAAGVSPATVSRVLSKNAYVIDETKDKVLKAIKQTGYRVPSKSKEQSRQKNILLVICSSLRDQGSSYFLEGIERRASEAGYSAFIKHMVMSQIIHGSLNADTMMAWVRECGASGLLVFSDAVDVGSLLEISDQIPVVTMMTEYSNPRISSVDVDEEDMMRKCFRHLIATGKDRIALITGQMMYRRSQVLKECYHSLIEEMGLEENPNWCAVIDTNYYSTSAAIAAEQMLKNPDPPNAFITTADIYAAGVIYACDRLGLSMPDDVAVVGRDNSSICHVSIPQITSFNMPSEMIGYTACNSLIAKIENAGSNTRNIVVPCDLIIRGSTAKNNN